MHVAMFGDQHLETLGGAQVSMRLQRRFLERAGHTVSVIAPGIRGPRGRGIEDAGYLDMPSVPITPDREYSFTWPGSRTDKWVDAAIAARGPVDVVHVQADFWGALVGHRFAARHSLPVVHTMHNRVDVGIQATTPAPGLVLRALTAWQQRALGAGADDEGRRSASASHGSPASVRPRRESATASEVGWEYLRRFAARSAAVTAPSGHFARRLESHGVTPAAGGVDVIWNGIDDDVLARTPVGAREPGRARFVWLGRMSPEKRLLPFLEAVVRSGVDADIEVIGGGGQLAAARAIVEKGRPVASVVFSGRMPYAQTLARIAHADAVVQTSVGFETQGMTVFEAAALGTPAVVADPDIAAELGSGYWPVSQGAGDAAGSRAAGESEAGVEALAAALRRAAADVASGTAPIPDPAVGEAFRQSSRTDAMIGIYRRVLAG